MSNIDKVSGDDLRESDGSKLETTVDKMLVMRLDNDMVDKLYRVMNYYNHTTISQTIPFLIEKEFNLTRG